MLKPALQEAQAVRRCWERLSPKEAEEGPLTAFLLPDERMALLSTRGGLGVFIEAGMQALGGEPDPTKVRSISEKAVRE